jgi:uncharacterized membrane protein
MGPTDKNHGSGEGGIFQGSLVFCFYLFIVIMGYSDTFTHFNIITAPALSPLLVTHLEVRPRSIGNRACTKCQ